MATVGALRCLLLMPPRLVSSDSLVRFNRVHHRHIFSQQVASHMHRCSVQYHW